MKKFLIYNLIGDVNASLEDDISGFINRALLTPEEPVLIAINSPGGNTDIGISIYNKLRALPNNVYTLITGKANSIANIIAMSAPFERRFAFENTNFFMHTASVRFNQALNYKPDDIQKEIEDLTLTNATIHKILQAETDIPAKELNEIFIKQDGEMKLHWVDFERFKIANVITKYDEII